MFISALEDVFSSARGVDSGSSVASPEMSHVNSPVAADHEESRADQPLIDPLLPDEPCGASDLLRVDSGEKIVDGAQVELFTAPTESADDLEAMEMVREDPVEDLQLAPPSQIISQGDAASAVTALHQGIIIFC